MAKEKKSSLGTIVVFSLGGLLSCLVFFALMGAAIMQLNPANTAKLVRKTKCSKALKGLSAKQPSKELDWAKKYQIDADKAHKQCMDTPAAVLLAPKKAQKTVAKKKAGSMFLKKAVKPVKKLTPAQMEKKKAVLCGRKKKGAFVAACLKDAK